MARLPDHISKRIHDLTFGLLLQNASKGLSSDYDQLKREAARRVAREQKRKPPKTAKASRDRDGELGLHNAVPLLISKIMRMASAMSSPPPSVSAPAIRKSVVAPEPRAPAVVPIKKQQQPEPPAHQIIGIYCGRSRSGAELIDDDEFHTSVRWSDRAIDNLRESIRRNEQIAKRDGRWIG